MASTLPKRTSGRPALPVPERPRIAQLQHALARREVAIGEGDEGIRARLHQPEERQVVDPVRPEQLGLDGRVVVQADPGLVPGLRLRGG